MMSISPVEGGLLAVAVSLAIFQGRRRNARLRYPPGPKGYPLIGNVFDIPQDVPLWKAAMPMAERYREWIVSVPVVCTFIPVSTDSDVVYLNMFGADYVILNSSEAISDLLDKRSSIYSDKVRSLLIIIPHRFNSIPATSTDDGVVSRICSTFQSYINELAGRMGVYSWALPLIGYNDQWKSGRRLFHEFLNPGASKNYDDLQYHYVRDMILRLAESPDGLWGILKL